MTEVIKQSELNDPELEKMINIYYFLKNGEGLRNLSNFNRDLDDVRGLIKDAFPRQYESQRLAGYSGPRIGHVFEGMWDSYHKKYSDEIKGRRVSFLVPGLSTLD